MGEISFSENNSGGSYWLSESDYAALEAAGWQRSVNGLRSLTKRVSSLAEGVAEWELLTGQSAGSVGCPCCGVPFSFDFDGDDGSWDSFNDYFYDDDYFEYWNSF